MIRLLGVELTRMSKRRAVIALVIAALAVPLLIMGTTLWSTRSVSDAEMADAQAQLERDIAGQAGEIQRCVDHPEEWGNPADLDKAEAERLCRDMMGTPELSWYISRMPLDLEAKRTGEGAGVVVIVTGLLALAAATFIGHDWNSGSMSNQLLFEPRRQRVFWAKALAVALAAAVVTALALALFWTGLITAMHLRDLDIPDGVLSDVWWTQVRAVVLASLTAVAAYAVTNLFRSTVVTLGLMFALAVASSIVIGLVPIVDRDRYQLFSNAGAWILGEFEYYRRVPMSCFERNDGLPLTGECREQGILTMWAGARYLIALFALAVVPSAWSFQRRDVP